MTGFHQKQGLRAYSGGTVPEFHRISYSLLHLKRLQQHFASAVHL